MVTPNTTARRLARDVLSLAHAARVPNSFWNTDRRILDACAALGITPSDALQLDFDTLPDEGTAALPAKGTVLERLADRARRTAARHGHVLERDLTDADVAERARANHIWLSAPSVRVAKPDFLQGIGAEVLRQLADSDLVDDLTGTSKVVYLRVNAS